MVYILHFIKFKEIIKVIIIKNKSYFLKTLFYKVYKLYFTSFTGIILQDLQALFYRVYKLYFITYNLYFFFHFHKCNLNWETLEFILCYLPLYYFYFYLKN